MKPSTQIEISAQVWVCDACGGHDRKSCGCANAKASASIEERARKTVETLERRDREKKNKQNQCSDPRVENTEESGNGHDNGSAVPKLNAVGKPYGASYDPNYKIKHKVQISRSAGPMGEGSYSWFRRERFVRKDPAKFEQLVNDLIAANLARGLLGELRSHGATFLVEALEDRLSRKRKAAIDGSALVR